MLDLNLNFDHQDERTAFRGEVEESGTSNSSAVNAEGCNSSNADDDSISAAGDGDSFQCFNFDILNVGDTAALPSNNDEDRTSQTRSEFVTRMLFPASHGGGTFNQGQQMTSFLLFPNNNESQETRMIQVQQQKPTVQQNHVAKKSRRGPRSRSSQYRGVTFYRRTGRWESHIWDCGKQVYLGGFDTAHAAARAYDRAAIKFRGVDADINFNLSDYEEDMNLIKSLSKEDFVQILRRHSNGFSRGSSKNRGFTMPKCGRWEAPTVHDNAAIKSNGSQMARIFGASGYEGETVSARNDQNLDLNLGISTPSCLGKGSSNLEPMPSNHRLQAENPVTMTRGGLPIISNHAQSWTGMYSKLLPSYEGGGGATNNGGPSSSWSHGQSHTPSTAAASSGFGAPAATASTTAHHYYYQMRPRPTPPPAPPPAP